MHRANQQGKPAKNAQPKEKTAVGKKKSGKKGEKLKAKKIIL